jgi:DNA recombination protein RmuC
MIYAIAAATLILGIAGGILIGINLGSRRQKIDLAVSQQRQSDLTQQLDVEKTQTQSLRENLAESDRNLASLRAQFTSAQQNLLEQRKLLEDAQHQLRQAFASASAEALTRNNETFLQLARERFATISAEATGSLEQRKEQIDALLKPLRELMGQYQIRLGEIEKSRVESYSMLREQLGVMAESQRTLSTQTSQLVTALSRPTTRGQWGEISLRRLVELAGLSNRTDFIEQEMVAGEQGRLKPDLVVHLPRERDVIVDCKTCFDAFLDAASATDEDNRKVHLQRHAQQVRARARDLSAKAYWSQFAHSPEYVIMFLPGEAFLYAAVENDPSIIEDCIKNRVLIATPTTLIALLKTIEFGWRQEEMTENAEQIKSLGVELYDRIFTVLSHIQKLGTNLDSAVKSYNAALGSLETRVLSTARKMADLGARSPKELPEPQLIEQVPREIQVPPVSSPADSRFDTSLASNSQP